MKRWSGVWLIFLIVGMSLSTAFSSTPVAATTSDPYEEFWQILNREAELVVQFNSTGNVTLAQELIQNSRLGAENAVNISVLIWQALEELKESGVKTYYTAEELREMAQNISRNGLPQETVQALKEQGWTDDEIRALEGYIAQNAGEINEDFNMTAFLEDFSTAFINVAFKYNHYETWTLRKWKWANTQKTPQANDNGIINPLLAKDWVEFYKAYSSGDYENMKSKAHQLRDSMYKLLTNEKRSCTLTFLKPGEVVIQTGMIKSVNYTTNGSLIFTTLVTETSGRYLIGNLTTYYWPEALHAYELSGNILALVTAVESGNKDEELESILNQKVSELKNALEVSIIESKVSKTVIQDEPIEPIEPIYPINPKLPVLPASVTGTKESTTEYSTSTTIMTPADEVTIKALDINDNEGILEITDVKVIVDVNQPGRVEYHVKVSFKAENNAVNDVQIHVEDYASRDSDSGSISFLNAGESYTWESKRFSYTHSSGGELIVSGRVEVTYTPSCNDVPLSSSPSCQERIITEEYSATVDLTSPVDWSKVGIRVEASRESITEGESVTYRVIVENNQNAELDGVEYSVTIPFSPTNSRTYSGVVKVNWTGEEAVFEKTVTYTDAGTYVVHASIYWNGHSKSAEKSVTVTSGTLSITDVDVSPANPTQGDSVSFDVSVKNPVSRSRTVTVKLFIDGQEKSSKSLTIGSGGSGVVSLTWSAQAGEHEWRIEVWEGGKLEASRSGGITVPDPPTSTCLSGVPLEGHLEVYPEWVEAGDSVSVHITVTNLDPNCAQGPFNIELVDDSGAKWWPKKDMNYGCSGCGYVIQDGALKIYAGRTMSEWTDFNNIGQATTLYLKVGGKTLASAKINVKQDGPVKASMECKPTVVPLDGSTTCTVHFELKSADTVTLNLEEIDFGGKKVWPNGPSSVTVNKQTVTLTPTNMQEDLSVTITINDELANYYFEERPWDPIDRYVFKESFKNRFAGYTYLVEAKFSSEITVNDVFEVAEQSGFDEAVDVATKGKAIVSEVTRLSSAGKKFVTVAGKYGKVVNGAMVFVSGFFLVTDLHDWLFAPTPNTENDGNNIVGG